MSDPTDRLLDHAFKIFTPTRKESVVEWAERNAYLSERVTEMAGRYSTSEHPYVREILNLWQDPKVKKVSLCWGSQTSKTTTTYVGLGWVIDRNPSPILWVWSNEKQARNFSNDRFLPFCEDSEAIARHLPRTNDGKIDRDRASALRIEFDRCSMNLIGGQSQRNVRNYPVTFLVLDEIDVIPEAIRKDVHDRVKGRRSYKIFQSSTPIEENGIWAEYLTGDRSKYFMPCPHCEEEIAFEWKTGKNDYRLQYPEEAKREDGSWDFDMVKNETFYSCQSCGGQIRDSDKFRMLRQGKWKPTAKGEPGVRSFHLSSLYSPTITFGEMMIKWIKANDSLDGLKQFITGWLAEPWKDELLNATEEATHELSGDYERGDMMGEFRLMAVDVQRAHFVWLVRGYDQDGTSYLIDHGYAPSYTELDDIFSRYECSALVMDTGFGERTQENYEAIWRRRSKWWASKGWKSLTTPVSIKAIDPFSGTNKSGKYKLRLLHVDSSVFGGEILKRRSRLVEGFKIYRDPDRDYIKQLNGKFIVESVTRTGEVKQEWRTKRHGQDHFFDCEVYIHALSKVLGLGAVKKKETKENEKEPKPKKAKPRNDQSFW